MRFNLALLFAAVTAVSATPTSYGGSGKSCGASKPPSKDPSAGADKFALLSLRSASPVHFLNVDAAQGSLFLNLADQKATCAKGKKADSATFYIKDGGLFLYSDKGAQQRVYVDRSGMGQGVVQYASDPKKASRNAESTGWALDKSGDLTFDGASFLACPYKDGAYVLWVSAGNANPGGNKDCLGISARSTVIKEPLSCVYTQGQ